MSALASELITRLPAPLRNGARRALARGLGAIPLPLLEPLRRAYPASRPGSAAERLQNLALQVVRYRSIPQQVDSFPLADNPAVRIARCDSFVAERLYWFGERKGYEPEVLRWWRHYCRRATQVLELGANIGYFTVQGALANPAARYTAVEPHPSAAAACRRNLELNGVTSVSLVEAAAVPVAGAGEVELLLPGGRDHYEEAPSSSFAAGSELHDQFDKLASYRTIKVKAVALATLVEGVDLLKMDVEGQEHRLLSSVEEQIRSQRPVMFLEMLDGTHRLRGLLKQLCDDLPYRCYVPTTGELVRLDPAELKTVSIVDRFGTQDLVLECVPEEAAG